jgi:hypothetical protein
MSRTRFAQSSGERQLRRSTLSIEPEADDVTVGR